MSNGKINSVIGLLLVAIFFMGASYYVQNNLDYIQSLIGTSFLGVLVYIDILILAAVFAPINDAPFIAIATNLWGWVTVAFLSIIGWTLGAILAFSLARAYGVILVKKIIPIKKIHEFEKKIPEKHLFWSIVFLRITVPFDALSYVFGLFSRIKLWQYSLATFLGVAPYAIVFSYLGALPFSYQLFTFVIGIIVIAVCYGVYYFFKKKRK